MAERVSRRKVIRACWSGICATGAFGVLAACGRRSDASACVDESGLTMAQRGLRTSLEYRTAPAGADVGRCRDCSFFTGEPGGTCGECRILAGPVDSVATCTSWAHA